MKALVETKINRDLHAMLSDHIIRGSTAAAPSQSSRPLLSHAPENLSRNLAWNKGKVESLDQGFKTFLGHS